MTSLLNLYLHLPPCRMKLLTPHSCIPPASAAYTQMSWTTPPLLRYSHLPSSCRQLRSRHRLVGRNRPFCSPGLPDNSVETPRVQGLSNLPRLPSHLLVDLSASSVCIPPSHLHPPSNTNKTTSRKTKENSTTSNSRGSCYNITIE